MRCRGKRNSSIGQYTIGFLPIVAGTCWIENRPSWNVLPSAGSSAEGKHTTAQAQGDHKLYWFTWIAEDCCWSFNEKRSANRKLLFLAYAYYIHARGYASATECVKAKSDIEQSEPEPVDELECCSHCVESCIVRRDGRRLGESKSIVEFELKSNTDAQNYYVLSVH